MVIEPGSSMLLLLVLSLVAVQISVSPVWALPFIRTTRTTPLCLSHSPQAVPSTPRSTRRTSPMCVITRAWDRSPIRRLNATTFANSTVDAGIAARHAMSGRLLCACL